MPDVSESTEELLVASRGDLLFTSNDAGYLVRTNEPGEPDDAELPALYICIGRNGVFTRQSDHLNSEDLLVVTEHLRRLHEKRKPSVQDVIEALHRIVADYRLHLRAQVGPAYMVNDISEPMPGAFEVRPEHRDVLLPHFPFAEQHLEAFSPCLAVVVSGKAVCACRSVRRSAIALEAGVDTVEAYRRQGFAKAAVVAWGRTVWEMGLVPCYSAHWENRASIGLAERLKMKQFAIDVSLYG